MALIAFPYALGGQAIDHRSEAFVERFSGHDVLFAVSLHEFHSFRLFIHDIDPQFPSGIIHLRFFAKLFGERSEPVIERQEVFF